MPTCGVLWISVSLTFDETPLLTRWEQVATQLRERPGTWAWVDDVPTGSVRGTAHSIRNGRFKAFRPVGHFEAEQRQGRLRARYVGPARRRRRQPPTPHPAP